jgi:WD40 repeat protein/tRNA A-37 threonylcarbamoyl transferase component Bud32
MAQKYQCHQGHQWSQAAAAPPATCPLCQSKQVTRVDAGAEIKAGSHSEELSLETLARASPHPLSSNPPAAHSDSDTKPTGGNYSGWDETLERVPQPASSDKTENQSLVDTNESSGWEETLVKSGQSNQGASASGESDADKTAASATNVAYSREKSSNQFDEYEILGELGRGGMGVVYKARQVQLNRLTALKMILAGGHAGSEDRARFQIEARAVAQLQHPNIVQIYEIGEQQGNSYLALEYIDGGSLADRMEGKPLPAKRSAQLVRTLAQAMAYAHERGIVHRDLKPANVLLTRSDNPKITDFGLAKQLSDDSHQTQSGSILGTPSFMSPEQAEGKTQEIGPASDIYALGAILYTMLTGRPPFQGQSVLDTLDQVKNAEPVPPNRLQPNVPRDLETICLKCLRKEPAKRYPSAQELALDLDRYLSNQPILARPVGLWEHGIKWARRHPTVAVLLLVLLVVLVGGFFIMTGLYVQTQVALAESTEAHKEAESQKERAMTALALESVAKQEADRQTQKAEASFQKSRQFLYVKKINQVHVLLDEGYPDRAMDILQDMAATEGELRGFEWDYLWKLCRSTDSTLKGHTNRISSFTLNQDRSLLATASHDQHIRVWKINNEDTQSEKTPGKVDGWLLLRRHEKPIRTLVFAPSGKILASATTDGTIYLWDISEQTAVPLPPLDGAAFGLGFVPAAASISVTTSVQQSMPNRLVWKWTGQNQGVSSLTFNAAGTLLASGGNDGVVRVWDARTGTELFALKDHQYPVTCVAFNSQDDMLASGSEDRTVRLWDLNTGKRHGVPLVGHAHWVSCVAFSPDGQKIAAGGWDHSVRIWDLQRKKEPIHLDGPDGHQFPVRDLGFSPDGTRLASMDKRGVVKIWDLINPYLLKPKTLQSSAELMPTVSFSTDSTLLASLGINMGLEEPPPAFTGHANSVTAVAIGTDPETQAPAAFSSSWRLRHNSQDDTTTASGEVMVWDWQTDTTLQALTDLPGAVRCLSMEPRQQILAAGTENGTVLVWDFTKDRQWSKELPSRVLSLCFLPQEKQLAIACGKEVLFWDWQTDTITDRWTSERGNVKRLAYFPGNHTLALATDLGSVLLRKVGQKGSFRELTGHQSGVLSIAFDDQGKVLASGGEDQTIVLWNVATGEQLATLAGHIEAVTGLAFCPGENRLASAGLDSSIILWDLRTYQEVLRLTNGHKDGITGLAFSPDGGTLLSSGWDGIVRIWQSR